VLDELGDRRRGIAFELRFKVRMGAFVRGRTEVSKERACCRRERGLETCSRRGGDVD